MSGTVDAIQLAVAGDPYQEYARLRELGPLVAAGPGMWAVPRRAEVVALLTDARLTHRFPDEFRHFAVGRGATAMLLQGILSSIEDPAHAEVRARLGELLQGAGKPLWWQLADQLISDRVAEVLAAGRFDGAAELARPLAAQLAAALLGVNGSAAVQSASYAQILGRAFTAMRLTRAEQGVADATVDHARLTFARAFAGTKDGGDPEWIDNLVFLYYTAYEMIAGAVMTCCALLSGRPDTLATLRARPDLLPTAVSELLRFDSPVQGTARLVREPLDVAGRRLRPGRIVLLLLGSANRDETFLPGADLLDITRSAVPLLSFGAGPYRCLGEHLALELVRRVVAALFLATGQVVADGPPTRRPPESLSRSWDRIPLVVTGGAT